MSDPLRIALHFITVGGPHPFVSIFGVNPPGDAPHRDILTCASLGDDLDIAFAGHDRRHKGKVIKKQFSTDPMGVFELTLTLLANHPD